MRRRVWLVLGVLMLSGVATAMTPPPPPCPGVRFLTDHPLLPGATGFDAVVVDAQGRVGISNGCVPLTAKLTKTKTGVRVRVKWIACGTLTNAKLTATVDANACATATGRFTARHVPAVRFAATPSTCGDGRVDAGGGEACDVGHACVSADPCSSCTCGSTTTVPGTTTTSTTLAGLFEQPNPWNTPVDGLPKSAQSDAIIATLDAAGGWGGPGQLQIDFSFHLLHAAPTDPTVMFLQGPGYYSPDCDPSFAFPLPPAGAIEGHTTYVCPVASEDCHFLIVDPASKRLIELYNATKSGTSLRTRCGVQWDLTKAYPPDLRGDQCTSADAAGFPIGAMLFTADEVAAGEIPHAIRFILPNERIKAGVFVHPATHAGGPAGVGSFPPYGVRFRLRADFPLNTLSAGAQVVAKAMQTYGMLLSDGGNIALTAADDADTAAKWSDVGIDSHALYGIAVTDFEVVDLGPEIPLTYDCVRNP